MTGDRWDCTASRWRGVDVALHRGEWLDLRSAGRNQRPTPAQWPGQVRLPSLTLWRSRTQWRSQTHRTADALHRRRCRKADQLPPKARASCALPEGALLTRIRAQAEG